jgi:hypothetical protein
MVAENAAHPTRCVVVINMKTALALWLGTPAQPACSALSGKEEPFVGAAFAPRMQSIQTASFAVEGISALRFPASTAFLQSVSQKKNAARNSGFLRRSFPMRNGQPDRCSLSGDTFVQFRFLVKHNRRIFCRTLLFAPDHHARGALRNVNDELSGSVRGERHLHRDQRIVGKFRLNPHCVLSPRSRWIAVQTSTYSPRLGTEVEPGCESV